MMTLEEARELAWKDWLEQMARQQAEGEWPPNGPVLAYRHLYTSLSTLCWAHAYAKPRLDPQLKYKIDAECPVCAKLACCTHRWVHTGTGNHGSDKGDRYYQCSLCSGYWTQGGEHEPPPVVGFPVDEKRGWRHQG